ncbi:SrfA family protein [Acerihabitans sp. KWT182]|uniref:SrfA family protein n=1 Tax=Acerihabitans sp. KWT182 TaxID=3157919 RepID=A0AAU7QHW6_9GAMM
MVPDRPAQPAAVPRRRARLRLWWILPFSALLAILILRAYDYLANAPAWPPTQAPMPEPHALAPSIPMTAAPGAESGAAAQADGSALPGKNRPTTAIDPAPAADGSGRTSQASATGVALSGIAASSAAGNAALAQDKAASAIATAAKAATASDAAAAKTVNSLATPAAGNGAIQDDTRGSLFPNNVTASQNSLNLTPSQAKNALRLPAEAVKAGSTAFLNGRWRVSVAGRDSAAGKAASMSYVIKNGNGVAKMRLGNKIICRADVHAGLMKSGNLVLRSQVKARCTDGSSQIMPQILCKQNNGAAVCQSRYDNGQPFATLIKRENEK